MSSHLDFAIEIARKAGVTIKQHYHGNLNIQSKDTLGRDLVTQADLESEKVIINAIREKYPDHHILAEETEKTYDFTGHTWMIDPLDGTTNFSKGLPLFSVSIALAKDETPLVGVVYDPIQEKLFTAEKGKGAYLDNSRIHVSAASSLANAVVMRNINPTDELRKRDIIDIEKLLFASRSLRILNSTALELCLVASGMLDAHVVADSNPWDIAAGGLIVEEAGGKVTAISGEPWSPRRPSIIASNGKIHEEVIQLLGHV